MIIPSLEKLTKEGGEEGRKKINKYTKMLTVVLALIEGIGIYLSYKSSGIFVNDSFLTGALVVVGLITGTTILMTTLWGLIMPSTGFSTTGLLTAIGILIGAIILIAGVVFVQQAERRIPVQYSKKVVGRKMMGAQNTHIPLKLAMDYINSQLLHLLQM